MVEEVKQEVQAEEVTTEQPTEAVQTEDTKPNSFEIPTEAQDYVGEGKKYKSPEDALKSVPHAQEHISTLEAELAEVKEELTKRKTTQELLDEIKSGQQVEATTSQPEVNQDTLEQLVQNTLERRDQAAHAKTNATSVSSKFTEKYGSAAEATYNQIAKESGLTVQQLNSLAATSPNAVLKLAGLDAKVSTETSKSTGTVNTQTLTGNPSEVASARVRQGASTKDLVRAWKIAGEKVKS